MKRFESDRGKEKGIEVGGEGIWYWIRRESEGKSIL